MLPGQGTIASIAFRLVGPAKGLTPTYYLNHGMPCSPSEHLITLTDAASDAVGTNFRSRDDKQTSAYTSVGKGFLEHLPYAFMGINRRCMHSTSPSNQKWHGKWKATSYSRMDAESSRKKHADYMKRQRRAEANRMLRKWRSMELDADDQATVSRCSSRTRAAFPGSNEPRLSQVSGHEVPRRLEYDWRQYLARMREKYSGYAGAHSRAYSHWYKETTSQQHGHFSARWNAASWQDHWETSASSNSGPSSAQGNGSSGESTVGSRSDRYRASRKASFRRPSPENTGADGAYYGNAEEEKSHKQHERHASSGPGSQEDSETFSGKSRYGGQSHWDHSEYEWGWRFIGAGTHGFPDLLNSEVVAHRMVLGLPPRGDHSLEVLKLAFRKCALLWHPDRHIGADKVLAEAKFKRVAAAYEALLPSKKRGR